MRRHDTPATRPMVSTTSGSLSGPGVADIAFVGEVTG
jgi:hypothetical protein